MKKRIKPILFSIFLQFLTFFSLFPSEVYAASDSPSGDPVYDSMTLPSESQSDFMKSVYRDRGQILGDTSSPNSKKVLAIGSIYLTSEMTLPEKFNIYLGRITLFAFSKSQNKWIILDDQKHPLGIYLYSLPWETSKSKAPKHISYTDDYAQITLTAEEMESCVLHFWAKTQPIDKNDYLHYACAYDFWVDKPAEGKFTAANAVDCKDGKGQITTAQLYSSRGLSSSTTKKTHWGHDVPLSDYYKYHTSDLNKLYNNVSDKEEKTSPDTPEDKTPADKEPTPEETVPSKPEPDTGDSDTPTPDPDAGDSDTPTPKPDAEDSDTPTPKPDTEDSDTPTPKPDTEDSDTPTPKPDTEDSDTPNPKPTPDTVVPETPKSDPDVVVPVTPTPTPNVADSEPTKNASGTTEPSVKPATTRIIKKSISKNSIQIDWKKGDKKISGYQIQYSSGEKFKKNDTINIYVNNRKTHTKLIQHLKSRHEYYFRIRTIQKTGSKKAYSKWSKIKIIKTR